MFGEAEALMYRLGSLASKLQESGSGSMLFGFYVNLCFGVYAVV